MTESTGSWDELLDAPGEVVDLDQDGTPDTVIIDTDEDSVPDTALVDTDADGVADVAVVDVEAGSATAQQPPEEPAPTGPGYQDPFEGVEPHVDPSYEMPEALETASDDVFNSAMAAEQQELENLDNTNLS